MVVEDLTRPMAVGLIRPMAAALLKLTVGILAFPITIVRELINIFEHFLILIFV